MICIWCIYKSDTYANGTSNCLLHIKFTWLFLCLYLHIHTSRRKKNFHYDHSYFSYNTFYLRKFLFRFALVGLNLFLDQFILGLTRYCIYSLIQYGKRGESVHSNILFWRVVYNLIFRKKNIFADFLVWNNTNVICWGK